MLILVLRAELRAFQPSVAAAASSSTTNEQTSKVSGPTSALRTFAIFTGIATLLALAV